MLFTLIIVMRLDPDPLFDDFIDSMPRRRNKRQTADMIDLSYSKFSLLRHSSWVMLAVMIPSSV